MNNETRLLFDKFMADMARTYGIKSVRNTFAATPSVEQRLVDKVTLASDFLQKINVILVNDQEGQKVIGGVAGLIGKRTNTATNDRATADVLNLDNQPYRCEKTEYDVHIKYATLDAWAKFPDFNDRFLNYVRHAIALARIRIGFNGTSVAAASNGTTYPNGEDVNKGWFQKLREYNSGAQMLDEGGTTGQIRVGGTTGDYSNLDALVYDILQMVEEPYRNGGDLVAIVGQDLLAYDKTQLYISQGNTPTEKERLESNAVVRTYGGLPAVSVPLFPARGLLITSYDNLSVYLQSGSIRQKIEDNAKRDRIDHYNSMNEAFVVEDEGKAAGIEFANVRLWNGSAFA